MNTTEFLQANNIAITKTFLKRDLFFKDDKEKRNIFNIEITTPSYTFDYQYWDSVYNTYSDNNLIKRYIIDNNLVFWDITPSLKINRLNNNPLVLNKKEIELLKNTLTKSPSDYDILSYLWAEYFEWTFKDFCNDFWYDEDSIKALETFEAMQKQTRNIKRAFTLEQINYMQENFN